MVEDSYKLLMELCRQASTEQDPKKLLVLTTEINRLLVERERVESKPPANSTDTYIHTTPSLAAPREIEPDADPSHPQKRNPETRAQSGVQKRPFF